MPSKSNSTEASIASRQPCSVNSPLAQEIRARPGGASADQERVAAAGARVGAELALYATLSKPGKDQYRFTLEAVEVNTAEHLWTGAMDLGVDQLRRLMTGG